MGRKAWVIQTPTFSRALSPDFVLWSDHWLCLGDMQSKQLTLNFYLFYVWGPHPGVLFTTGHVGEPYTVEDLWCWTAFRQAPELLYYLSGSTNTCFDPSE